MPNPGELGVARKVLAGIRLQGLSEYTGKPALLAPRYDYAAPQFVDPKLPVSDLDLKDSLQFWDILSAAMNENPSPANEISAVLPMFEPLGLELGKQWDRSKVDPIILKAGTSGTGILRVLCCADKLQSSEYFPALCMAGVKETGRHGNG